MKSVISLKSALIFGFCAILAACSSTTKNNNDEQATVATANTIELTVPQSQVQLSIPKLNLTRQRHSKGSNYFFYADQKENFFISGWFEPVSAYAGSQALWQQFVQHMKNNPPQNVEMFTLNQWEVTTYDMYVMGHKQANIKAHWTGNGTWIDVHLSSMYSPESGAYDLLSYFKQMTVKLK